MAANTQEVVRRLLYQYRSEGADKVVQAQDAITSSTEKTDRASLSLEKSFNSLERRYVATVRHQQDYQKTQDRVNAAVAQNPALQQRANVLLAEAREYFDRAGVAAGRFAAVQTELQAASAGFASGLGGVGTILMRLGPAGLAAGAGIAVAILALTKMISAGKHLADEAGKMVDFSESIGLSTTALQALRKAGAEVGIDAEKVTTSFEKFSVQIDEARQGSGSLYEALNRINPELAQEIVLVKDVAQAWDVLNRAREQATTIEQKNALARAAFGRGGVGMGRLQDLSTAKGGIEGLTAGMNELNSLTESELKRLDRLGGKIKQVSHEANVNFTSIFSGPALTAALTWQLMLLDITHLLKGIGKIFPGAPPKQTGYDQASIAEPGGADKGGKAAGHTAAAQAMTAEQQATINLGIAQQQLTSIYGGVSVTVATRLLQMQMEANMAMQLDQVSRNSVAVEQFAQGVRLQKLTTMEQEALITQRIITLNTQLAASFLQSSQQRMTSMQQQVQAAQLELSMMNQSNQAQTQAQLQLQMTQALNASVIAQYGEKGLAAIQAGNAELLASQMATGARQQLADAIVQQINNYSKLEQAMADGNAAEIAAVQDKIKAQELIIRSYMAVVGASDEKAKAVIEGYLKEQAEIQATAAALAALRNTIAVNTKAAADAARQQVQNSRATTGAQQQATQAQQQSTQAQQQYAQQGNQAFYAHQAHIIAQYALWDELTRKIGFSTAAIASFNAESGAISVTSFATTAQIWTRPDGTLTTWNPAKDAYGGFLPGLTPDLYTQEAQAKKFEKATGLKEGEYTATSLGLQPLLHGQYEKYKFDISEAGRTRRLTDQINSLLGPSGTVTKAFDTTLQQVGAGMKEAVQPMQALIGLAPKDQQAGMIQAAIAAIRQQPITLEREQLIKQLTDQMQGLTNSTNALNSTMQQALSPYYSQDPRTTKLGFRAGVMGNPDWMVPGASNENPLAAILGAGATAPGMASGGSFVVGGGYSSVDNKIAQFPVASGEQVIVNRRPGGQPTVVNNDNRIVINGNLDQDTLSKLKVSRFQQAQRMRRSSAA